MVVTFCMCSSQTFFLIFGVSLNAILTPLETWRVILNKSIKESIKTLFASLILSKNYLSNLLKKTLSKIGSVLHNIKQITFYFYFFYWIFLGNFCLQSVIQGVFWKNAARCFLNLLEGTLVKVLFHCKLENRKKLIESLLFAEHTLITGQGFHI